MKVKFLRIALDFDFELAPLQNWVKQFIPTVHSTGHSIRVHDWGHVSHWCDLGPKKLKMKDTILTLLATWSDLIRLDPTWSRDDFGPARPQRCQWQRLLSPLRSLQGWSRSPWKICQTFSGDMNFTKRKNEAHRWARPAHPSAIRSLWRSTSWSTSQASSGTGTSMDSLQFVQFTIAEKWIVLNLSFTLSEQLCQNDVPLLNRRTTKRHLCPTTIYDHRQASPTARLSPASRQPSSTSHTVGVAKEGLRILAQGKLPCMDIHQIAWELELNSTRVTTSWNWSSKSAWNEPLNIVRSLYLLLPNTFWCLIGGAVIDTLEHSKSPQNEKGFTTWPQNRNSETAQFCHLIISSSAFRGWDRIVPSAGVFSTPSWWWKIHFES